MYGSTGEKMEEKSALIEDEHHELIHSRQGKSFFEGPFENAFWDQVEELYETKKIPWSDALDQAHYGRVIENAKKAKKDPAEYLIVDVVNEFWNLPKPKEHLLELFPSYEKHVSRLVKLVVDKEIEELNNIDDSRYLDLLEPALDGIQFSVLHLAAKQNLKEVSQILLERYDGLQYVQSDGEEFEKIPVEYVLMDYDDNISRDGTAAVLLNSMWNERVRRLFQAEGSTPAKLSFTKLLGRKDMNLTVTAVLNSMINPDWPYVLVKEDDNKKETKWQTDPNLPIRYHFFYQILDQDEEGFAPKMATGVGTEMDQNPNFKHVSTSGLLALSRGSVKKFAVKHPVVRQLIDRKWNAYGEKIIWFQAALYFLFLVFLSISFLLAAHEKDPLSYKKDIDRFRAFCEVCVLLFSLVYLFDEVDQMRREGCLYLNWFNFMDLSGLVLLFTIVPLRYLNVSGQWIVMAMAFIINFLRSAKYFFAWKSFGVYARVLQEIIKKDLTIFGALYAIILCAFTGGIFLAMKATGDLNKVKGFGDVVLRGVRALVEGKEFADDYDGFNGFVLFLILVNMAVVIVLLFNLLIAQLSNRYETAKSEAQVQYDIDKIDMVCRIENSRFRIWNLRMKYYKDGDYINDIEKIADYISVWNETVKLFGLQEKKEMLEEARQVWFKSDDRSKTSKP